MATVYEKVLAVTSVVAVSVSALTAVLIGIQTHTLSTTLDTPYKANLQNRQIDACVEFLKRHELELPNIKAAERIVDSLNVRASEAPAGVFGSPIGQEDPFQGFLFTMLEARMGGLEALRQAIGGLSPFAGEVMSQHIARAREAAIPQRTLSFQAALEQMERKFSDLRSSGTGPADVEQNSDKVEQFGDKIEQYTDEPVWTELESFFKFPQDLDDYETEATPIVVRCKGIMKGENAGLL